MSRRPGAAPRISGAPGARSCIAVAAPKNSAMFMVAVAATVSGAVPPVIGIGRTSTGTPSAARSVRRIEQLAVR